MGKSAYALSEVTLFPHRFRLTSGKRGGPVFSGFRPARTIRLPAVAAIAIPVADTFEIDGSFVNSKGMTQHFSAALPAPADIAPAWKAVADLAASLGHDLGFTSLEGLRKELEDTAEAAQ